MDMTFEQAFREMIGPIYPVIVYMLFPTAIALSAICLFTMIFIQNEKAVEASKQWLRRIIVGTAVLLLLGTFYMIVSWIIKTLFDTGAAVPRPR